MLWRVNTLKNSKVLVCGGRSHTEDIDHYFQKQPIGIFSCNREILSAKNLVLIIGKMTVPQKTFTGKSRDLNLSNSLLADR